MKISDLAKNPDNPRTITDAKRKQLKKALLKFGDLSGIVFNRKTKQLVGGHQRRDAFDDSSVVTITKKYSRPTKTGTVAEGFVELNGERFTYREVHWDLKLEKAANIAANKGAGLFDQDKLHEWMQELSLDDDFDMDLTMFDVEELSAFEGITVKEHTRVNAKTGVDEDDVPEKAPAITQPGDAYILGRHRLLCGDSTNELNVKRLMGSNQACITFTSPPYNLGDNAKLRGHNADGEDTVYNEKSDHKSQADYLTFLQAWSAQALNHSKYLFCNIQMLAGNKIALSEYWFHLRDHLVDLMVWDKEFGAPAMPPRVLNSVWEFIFIFAKEQNPKRSIKTGPEWRGTLNNIVRLNPRRGPKEESAATHGAVFPVQFAQHFIESFSDSSVLDLFGGTGSTMIACEKTQRRCFMMELDPHYCDVIVARWEKYTGLKAKRVPSETKTRKPVQSAKETANGKSKSEAAAQA